MLAALSDPDKYVVVQTAPSIRATLGECFGMPVGTNVEGKMVAALRRLGFKKVFDTDFGADLTIMEEAHEFLDRVKNGGTLPMITSCSPGWIKFCEHYFPELLPNVSSCKSPQQMTGAMIKTWFAQKEGIDPKKIVVVSIMPCTAKKFEIQRDDMEGAGEGIPDAVYKIAGMDVKVAVVSGLNNANEVLTKVKNGEADYHFIEIMCCPGGCVNGGGQPIQPSSVRNFTDLRALRAQALYTQDENMPLRKSHENPLIKKAYEEFLGEPGSHKAHELLHTTYVARSRY